MLSVRPTEEANGQRAAQQQQNQAIAQKAQRAKSQNRARSDFARYQVPSRSLAYAHLYQQLYYSISLYGIGLGVVLQDRVAVQALGVYVGPYYFPSTTGLYIRVGIGSTSIGLLLLRTTRTQYYYLYYMYYLYYLYLYGHCMGTFLIRVAVARAPVVV